jgi:hypothetical protein
MTRAQPSPAISWLIEELAEKGIQANPPKIERLQSVGLAPRPVHHRSDTLSGEGLWPPGILDHYCAVVPLVRQRHAATEIAAITMVGWGFPVDIGLLRRSYARAYSLGDHDQRADDLLTHYQNRGVPMFRNAMAHVRTHGLAQEMTAEDLASDLIDASLSFGEGSAGNEQIQMMLAVALPKYSEAPDAVINWVVQMFGRLQTEFSLQKLLDTVNESSTEDLLRCQPMAATELDTNIAHLGAFEVGCRECEERRGYMVGLSIPMHLRIEALPWDLMVEELAADAPNKLIK